MIVHVYSVMRNEEKLLPYFLRHYEQFADRIYIYDDHSTDRTREIATAHPKVVLENLAIDTGDKDADIVECFNTVYKQSRGIADYVIIADGDELVYHPDMIAALERAKQDDIFLIKTIGYSMIGDMEPRGQGQLYDEYKDGIREHGFDKPCIFNPNIEVVFDKGHHHATSKTEQIQCNFLLLHFRYLSRDFYLERSKENYARFGMQDKDRKYRLGRGLEKFDARDNFTIERVV